MYRVDLIKHYNPPDWGRGTDLPCILTQARASETDADRRREVARARHYPDFAGSVGIAAVFYRGARLDPCGRDVWRDALSDSDGHGIIIARVIGFRRVSVRTARV